MKHSYIWFSPEATQELKRRLNAASDKAIVKFQKHRVWGKDESYIMEVVDPMAPTMAGSVVALDDDDPINDSRVCPPICP